MTLVQRAMDREHKACFDSDSIDNLSVSTVAGKAFIISHSATRCNTGTSSLMQKLVFRVRRLAFASCECVACREGGRCPHVIVALKVLDEGWRSQDAAN